MTIRPIVISMALAALLAACDRAPATSGSTGQAAPPADAASSGATTRTTPAEITPPASQADRREGRNPQQGQVDPKQSEQRQDFQQPGDDKGPQPKPGG
jgi:hypothetical protein